MKTDDPCWEEIKKQPKSKWPIFWCYLNAWEFPKELTKPEWWDSPSYGQRYNYLYNAMRMISREIGKTKLLEVWNSPKFKNRHILEID